MLCNWRREYNHSSLCGLNLWLSPSAECEVFTVLSEFHCQKRMLHLNVLSFIFSGAKAKAIINQSRENVARMVGGKAEDIIFTSGGTEVGRALF